MSGTAPPADPGPRDTREVPLVERARSWATRTALLDEHGALSYGELLARSAGVARGILSRIGHRDLRNIPLPFLVPASSTWAAVQWGVWRAGAMAVPLGVSHPARELAYVLDDAAPPLVVAHPSLRGRIEAAAGEREIPVVSTRELPASAPASGSRLPGASPDDGALMIYTSGTTGRPKGVVHTHASLEAQARTLVEAWGWRSDDRILLVLPLHHLHGIVNVVGCALHAGASCRMLPGFEARETWERLAEGDLTLFMAVPTVYHRLMREWRATDGAERERWARGARDLRLMVSGSAALPAPLFEAWEEVTGHRLLERYGMSETGMILSNPLGGPRLPGHVGGPLPGVEVRLVDEEGRIVWSEGGRSGASAVDGEVQVRGPGLFREYWEKPDATREAFTEDGWFRTGDVARLGPSPGFRLLGRRSVDILKTGGYKVSALEIESVLLEHPWISECAVVGAPHPEWGQQVCAALVETRKPEAELAPDLESEEMRAWMKERLAPYKVPARIRVVESLPRNALGKVQKPKVLELFA